MVVLDKVVAWNSYYSLHEIFQFFSVDKPKDRQTDRQTDIPTDRNSDPEFKNWTFFKKLDIREKKIGNLEMLIVWKKLEILKKMEKLEIWKKMDNWKLDIWKMIIG